MPALLEKGTEAGERINSVTVFLGKEAGYGTLPAQTGERTGSRDGTGQSRLTAGHANAPGDKAEQDGKGRGRKRQDKAAQVAADRDKNPSDEMHRERTGGYATVGQGDASGTAPGGTLERNGAGRNGIGYNQSGAEKPLPGRASASDKGRKGTGADAAIGKGSASGTAPKIALEKVGTELPQGAATLPGDGDSVLVEVPIARYHFSDSTYRAEITGFDVRMERMEVYPRTVVRTVRSREPSRWGVSVGVGIAVTPSGRVEPALQLQVGWRLFALGRRRER